MNNIPTMMLTTGFKTDQNGSLTEIVTPNVVTTLDAPKKITFNGTTLNYVPSTAAALEEFTATKATGLGARTFMGFTALNKVEIPEVTALTINGANNIGTFYGCTSLQSVTMNKITTIAAEGNYYGCGAFRLCTSLVTVLAENLTTLTTFSSECGAFYGCTGLTSIVLPSLSVSSDNHSTSGAFKNCTSLQNVQLGSDGYPVTRLGNNTFLNCTQSGLTITVYTADGNAISGSPWGATNATIVWEEA